MHCIEIRVCIGVFYLSRTFVLVIFCYPVHKMKNHTYGTSYSKKTNTYDIHLIFYSFKHTLMGTKPYTKQIFEVHEWKSQLLITLYNWKKLKIFLQMSNVFYICKHIAFFLLRCSISSSCWYFFPWVHFHLNQTPAINF